MKLPFNPELITTKDKLKKDPAKVGEKVYEFMQKEQSPIEVGEIIAEYAHEYTEEVKNCIKQNVGRFESPFYIVVLHKKEPWSVNVMRNWFIARQSKPSAFVLRNDYPNHSNTVYRYDSKTSELKILWSLPTEQDARTIIKNFHLYDKTLVSWIADYNDGKLG